MATCEKTPRRFAVDGKRTEKENEDEKKTNLNKITKLMANVYYTHNITHLFVPCCSCFFLFFFAHLRFRGPERGGHPDTFAVYVGMTISHASERGHRLVGWTAVGSLYCVALRQQQQQQRLRSNECHK